MTNLAALLTATAGSTPDHPMITLDDLSLGYAKIHGLATDLAARLVAAGLQPDDRVCLILPNVPAYPVAFFATLYAGGIVVPMNPLLKTDEIAYYFSDSGARLCLAWADFADQAEPAGERTGTRVIKCGPLGPDESAWAEDTPEATEARDIAEKADTDTAVILYTSGTTGQPKGAELTHANLRLNAQRSARDVMDITAADTVMGCLPLFHVFGLTCGLLTTTLVGATLTLIPRFDPAKAVEVIERDKVTVFEGVPTMYAAILNHPDAETLDASSLRVCVSGGSAMPVEILRRFESQFGCRVLEGYGLSETSPVASFNMLDRPSKPGTIGRQIPGCELKLINADGNDVGADGGVGEIAVRGDNVMKGYWNRPEDTEAAIPDGWFRTGDLATVDDDGYYTIVDRKKDLIIRGGFNVYPREIEEVLYTHPDVLEAAVVAVPSDMMGEEVGAAVALKPDATATLEDVQAFVKEKVASYKYPRQVWQVEELPKGPTGKILRRKVQPPEED